MAKSRWSALPAARSKAPVLQIRLYAILAVLLVAAAAGIISTFAWLNAKPTPTTPTPQAVTASATVATNYLLGQSTVVPVAPPDTSSTANPWTLDPQLGLTAGQSVGTRYLYNLVLDKSGNHPYGYTISVYGPAPNTTYVETDYYVAITNYGTFEVAVPMYLTATGPQLAALPALSPYLPSASGSNSGLDYHMVNGFIAPTAPFNTAVQNWAEAFITGAPSLGSIVNNPTGATNYTSLSGFSLVSSTAIGAVPGVGKYAAYTYVRARLVIRSTSANGVTLTMDYDLMLETPNSGTSYNVVAWGPTGSASSLVPYQSNLSANQ